MKYTSLGKSHEFSQILQITFEFHLIFHDASSFQDESVSKAKEHSLFQFFNMLGYHHNF